MALAHSISIHALLAESDSVTTSFQGGFAISIHALLAESDSYSQHVRRPSGYFYPRSPCGERPHIRSTSGGHPGISIHALLAESDHTGLSSIRTRRRFLSTLSLRRATLFLRSGRMMHPYFYPRSPCGERLWADTNYNLSDIISIHALLAESDRSAGPWQAGYMDFYPRSPCGERPPRGGSCYLDNIISIHALLAESDTWARGSRVTYVISIHALLAESDDSTASRTKAAPYFYPRSPCGERPALKTIKALFDTISIHALLAESDPQHKCCGPGQNYFYPRSPCGERLRQSTQKAMNMPYFYPRSPCGERLRNAEAVSKYIIFLSTLSLRRATSIFFIIFNASCAFLSTLSLRRATSRASRLRRLSPFLSTLSLRRATVSCRPY